MPQHEEWPPIKEHCHTQGELISVEKKDQAFLVQMRCHDGLKSGIVSEELGNQLEKNLLRNVRLSGVGEWIRTGKGDWELKDFSICSFDVLDDDSLAEIADKLHKIKGSGWEELDDPFGHLEEMRQDR